MKSWCWSAALALLLSGPVFAHAKLESTDPAAGSSVAAPKSVTLTFGVEVRLATLALRHDGGSVPVKVDRGAAPARAVSVMLPTLAPGLYEVSWSAISANDGHVAKGSFSFTVSGA
jgi:methionine-rich copper-binding protein CopC